MGTPQDGSDAVATGSARDDDVPAPHLEDIQLSVSAVAGRLGVAPSTLRTWDRRYGLGPTAHTTGRHRRYAAADVARLERMQDGLIHGATPAEAARLALAVPEADLGSGLERSGPRLAGRVRMVGPGRAATTERAASGPVRAGGTALRMPGAGRTARGLARAALSLDTRATQRTLSRSIAEVGVHDTWDDVVRPVMAAISDRWADTGDGIEVEHLLSEAIGAVLSAAVLDAPPPVTARPVLLGSMPGDFHALPLRALAAVLAPRGVETVMLGPDLPVGSLAAAISRTGPSAVFLWAQLPGSADPAVLEQLPRTRLRRRCYVGGPGWATADMPESVTLLGSLREADHVLTAAAGA